MESPASALMETKFTTRKTYDVSQVSVLTYRTNYETKEHPAASYFAERRQRTTVL